MSDLLTVWQIGNDPDIRRRVEVAAHLSGVPNPAQWIHENILSLAATDGFATAWNQSETAPEGRGADLGVISDDMILAAVHQHAGGETS